MNNVDKDTSEAGVEPLRTWTAPKAEIHSIELVENTTNNFSNPSDGGGSPCRS
ncbi:MAG TPA: hypothetical protein VF652_07180 [Allosphingosinicella sp.]